MAAQVEGDVIVGCNRKAPIVAALAGGSTVDISVIFQQRDSDGLRFLGRRVECCFERREIFDVRARADCGDTTRRTFARRIIFVHAVNGVFGVLACVARDCGGFVADDKDRVVEINRTAGNVCAVVEGIVDGCCRGNSAAINIDGGQLIIDARAALVEVDDCAAAHGERGL